jgi:hypothetical protein
MTRAQSRTPTAWRAAIASFMKRLKVEAVYPMAYETSPMPPTTFH